MVEEDQETEKCSPSGGLQENLSPSSGNASLEQNCWDLDLVSKGDQLPRPYFHSLWIHESVP